MSQYPFLLEWCQWTQQGAEQIYPSGFHAILQHGEGLLKKNDEIGYRASQYNLENNQDSMENHLSCQNQENHNINKKR